MGYSPEGPASVLAMEIHSLDLRHGLLRESCCEIYQKKSDTSDSRAPYRKEDSKRLKNGRRCVTQFVRETCITHPIPAQIHRSQLIVSEIAFLLLLLLRLALYCHSAPQRTFLLKCWVKSGCDEATRQRFPFLKTVSGQYVDELRRLSAGGPAQVAFNVQREWRMMIRDYPPGTQRNTEWGDNGAREFK